MVYSKKGTLGVAVILLGACLFLTSGCANNTHKVGRKEVKENFSLKGAGHELGRGLTNVALCWLELFPEIDYMIRDIDDDEPLGRIIAVPFCAALGVITGTLWSVERAIGGMFEILLSPFPPYDPILDPSYPPYLNFKKAEEKKKDSEKSKTSSKSEE